MGIVRAVMAPHPPLIIPEVGRGEEAKISDTVSAYRQAARFIRDCEPDTVVITTPHSVLYADYFHVSPGKSASGDFARFGAGNVSVSVRYDAELTEILGALAEKNGLPAGKLGERDASLDHAALVPLYFLREAYGEQKLPAIVRIGLSGLPLTEHYRLGMLVKEAAELLNRNLAVIASGDLSHKLKEDGPYGYRPEGPEYDARIMEVMGRGAFGELFDFSEAFCDAAGECGHRSFTILAGCFDGVDVKAEKLSYEGPFGVGYGVCAFEPAGENEQRKFLDIQTKKESEVQTERRSREDAYVRLARQTVEAFVKTGQRAGIPEGLPAEMLGRRAGTFVSLHEHGRLRGCIGTITAAEDCIAKEIVSNAVSACSRDPRFDPVRPEELAFLEYSVDVLGETEEIGSPEELDVKRYGVIVTNGFRRGLLLPNLESVNTVTEQIAIAKKKAGIKESEKVSLQRFEVVRHF